MPKVLRIINRFNLGGPTYNVAYLSRYLPGEFETLLVGGEKDDSEGSSEYIVEQLGLKPRIIKGMRREISLLHDYRAYKQIKKIIREYKPDIVHTHASKAGALGRLAARSCGVPVIVHTFHGHVFHSYFGKLTTTFYKIVERYLAKRSDAIIAISEKQKQELCEEHRICSAEKTVVIPLGFDLNRFAENIPEKRKSFRSKWNLADDDIAVVIVGRIVPVKNHPLFLEAFAEALKKYRENGGTKNLKAFIVGDGELRTETENAAKALGLRISAEADSETDVYFTSWIKNVDEVYAGTEIVALSSWNEGTPVSLIEAQAAGKPIVTTDTGGISNVVLPGETALLSAPGDKAAFAANLYRLIDDETMRINFGSKGASAVMQRFHYTRLTADVAALYRKLLAQKKK